MPSAGAVGGGGGGPLIAGFCIPIRHQHQQEQNDCWAACLAMIFKWKGIGLTREQIFTSAPQHIPSYSYGEMASGAEVNRVAKRLTDNAVSFTRVTNINTRNADYWIQHINLFKPVLTTIGNHCRILMGYNGLGQLVVMDPNPHKAPGGQPEPIGIRFMQDNCTDAWVMD